MFEQLNYKFMNTATIPVYENNVMYGNSSLYVYKKRLYTKMIRIHLFSYFTIKTPRALDALVRLGLLIVKTLTHVL